MAHYELNKKNFSSKEARRALKCITSLGYMVTIVPIGEFDTKDIHELEDWLDEEGMLAFSDYIIDLPVSEIDYTKLRKYLKKFHGHIFYKLKHNLKTKGALLEYLKQFKTVGEFIASATLETTTTKNPNFGFAEQKISVYKTNADELPSGF